MKNKKTLSEFIENLEKMNWNDLEKLYPNMIKEYSNLNEDAKFVFGESIEKQIKFDLVSELVRKRKLNKSEQVDKQIIVNSTYGAIGLKSFENTLTIQNQVFIQFDDDIPYKIANIVGNKFSMELDNTNNLNPNIHFSHNNKKFKIFMKVCVTDEEPQLPIPIDNLIYLTLDKSNLYSLDNTFQLTPNQFDALLHKLDGDILNDNCFGFFGFRQDPDITFAGFLIKSIRRAPKDSFGYKVGIQILDNEFGNIFKSDYESLDKSKHYFKLDANFYDKNNFHSFVIDVYEKLENEI